MRDEDARTLKLSTKEGERSNRVCTGSGSDRGAAEAAGCFRQLPGNDTTWLNLKSRVTDEQLSTEGAVERPLPGIDERTGLSEIQHALRMISNQIVNEIMNFFHDIHLSVARISLFRLPGTYSQSFPRKPKCRCMQRKTLDSILQPRTEN